MSIVDLLNDFKDCNKQISKLKQVHPKDVRLDVVQDLVDRAVKTLEEPGEDLSDKEVAI